MSQIPRVLRPMLGRPLSECYGGHPLAPAVQSRVACEEPLKIAVGRTSEPPQTDVCDLLHPPRVGLAHAITVRPSIVVHTACRYSTGGGECAGCSPTHNA